MAPITAGAAVANACRSHDYNNKLTIAATRNPTAPTPHNTACTVSPCTVCMTASALNKGTITPFNAANIHIERRVIVASRPAPPDQRIGA